MTHLGNTGSITYQQLFKNAVQLISGQLNLLPDMSFPTTHFEVNSTFP